MSINQFWMNKKSFESISTQRYKEMLKRMTKVEEISEEEREKLQKEFIKGISKKGKITNQGAQLTPH